MVEINNQRKGVPRYAGVVGGLCRTSENRHGYDVIAEERRAIYWLLRSPSQTCHAKPKTQSTERRTPIASFPLVGCRKQLGLNFSPASGRSGIAWSRRGALPMIDRGDIRQAIDRCSNIGCWALVMVSSSIRLTAWLQNSKKRAERSEIDVWAESPRLSPAGLHHRLPVMGC